MKTLRVILGDQLSHDIPTLRDADPANDVILMAECADECRYVPHHKQKLVLFLSAMRHFSAALGERGLRVDYVALDDEGNTGSLMGELKRAVARHSVDRIIITEPGEWRVQAQLGSATDLLNRPVEVRPDTRFFASRARFHAWARGRRNWRMEHFYREMRREHGLLMDGDQPAGGQWNFDAENRKSLPADVTPPARLRVQPDAITRQVMALVGRRFGHHPGDLEAFAWPVTRSEALAALAEFVTTILPRFGDYQDAMKSGAPFLFHALLSPALNIGLLSPQEVCSAAEAAWRQGRAPINAVEGFVRQVAGWREYIRGVYWELMPSYAEVNVLAAQTPLPAFYWTGETDMRCMREVITSTCRHAYSHHIQRLMVTGNFALLAGIAPRDIERWYLAMYADALEWVEMPNTLGMAVFADGGRMASKPYAASGSYINRMSDFCTGCRYDVKQKSGPRACPFNYLYWAFLLRNEGRLHGNPRMAMPYRNLRQWGEEQRTACLAEAERFIGSLRP